MSLPTTRPILFKKILMIPIGGFILGGLLLVSSCSASQIDDREQIASAEFNSEIDSEDEIRKPIATASESAPDSCDRAREKALIFFDAIGSQGQDFESTDQAFDFGQEIGSSCGASQSGIVASEILVHLSNKIDQDSYTYPSAIRGIIIGTCRQLENTSIDGFSLTAEGSLVCAKSWESNGIDIAECRADLQTVVENLETYDNEYFDRLFRETLQSCGNRSTWLEYAPLSISNMLNASCRLYESEPVCKD